MQDGVKWTFKTGRFTVQFSTEQQDDYEYDGDDENGETQAALDSGELVAFRSLVEVFLDKESTPIGWDSLWGSVYKAGKEREFWTSHRDPNPMHRNCSIMRATRGKITICHYFPDMVREAVRMARMTVAERVAPPRMRNTARPAEIDSVGARPIYANQDLTTRT